jgi:hypothetical protein
MERSGFLYDNISDCLKKQGVNLSVDGRDQPINPQDIPFFEDLEPILSELTDNCVEKGAKNILLSLSEHSLTIEDDVVEKQPVETLAKLETIIKLSKNDIGRREQHCDTNGGFGIFYTISLLSKTKGNLSYYLKNGKIITKIVW